MTAAWIGFAGGVLATIVSAFVALRQSRLDERLARLNHELEMEQNRRAALFDRDLRAEEVLTRYREPLAAAAFDLQSRFYNILRLDYGPVPKGGKSGTGAFEGESSRVEDCPSSAGRSIFFLLLVRAPLLLQRLMPPSAARSPAAAATV
jgi:hypothetical protein